ncbi:MAG: DNA-3-methyladenine glycosylase [Candidatus Dormibacteria bacterium]
MEDQPAQLVRGPRLGRRFFARPSPEVARDLLGCWLVRRGETGAIPVLICETEAYLGEQDPASHARMGPTPRNLPMYGPPGVAYVYLIYGMHHCLNVVTGPRGRAEAVLLRAALPSSLLVGRRLDGPARLCSALGIDLRHNRLDLCSRGSAEVWFERGEQPPEDQIAVGPRVGVRDPSPLRFMTLRPGTRTDRSTRG